MMSEKKSMEWENAGFERDENGNVFLYWECSACGFTVMGGLEVPKCNCPNCGCGVEPLKNEC